MLRAEQIEVRDTLDAIEYFYQRGWTDGLVCQSSLQPKKEFTTC
ncbi:hypothetical protein [Neobacillus niacini]|nr:hypothetical protein [Neobacillus niacini]